MSGQILQDVTLRRLEAEDLPRLWHFIHGDPHPEWKRWDAPYFALPPFQPLQVWLPQEQKRLGENDSRRAIVIAGEFCGTTNWWWEDQASGWAEGGLVIYDPARWGRGLGTQALRLMCGGVFSTTPAHRLSLTTWSGNPRMIRAAQKLGFQIEGRIREARLWEGARYDSVRLGLLHREWRSSTG